MDPASRRYHYNRCHPFDALEPGDPRYVDIDKIDPARPVRGDDWVRRLAERIELSDRPVYELFTGLPGSGKSTELRRLVQRLSASHQLLPVLIDGENAIDLRGELYEALRIWREQALPVYEQLGDVRSRAIAQGRIADILFVRGELDEALRIRREEELPVHERLGDVRSRAITLGQIADILFARGELDEALRVRREEQLPIFEKTGDMRGLCVELVKYARMLLVTPTPDRIAEARTCLHRSIGIADRLELSPTKELRDLIAKLASGDPPLDERSSG